MKIKNTIFFSSIRANSATCLTAAIRVFIFLTFLFQIGPTICIAKSNNIQAETMQDMDSDSNNGWEDSENEEHIEDELFLFNSYEQQNSCDVSSSYFANPVSHPLSVFIGSHYPPPNARII